MSGLRTDRIPKAVADDLWPTDTNNGEDDEMSGPITVTTAHGEAVTVDSIEELSTNPEVRRQAGEVVKRAVGSAVERVNSASQDSEFRIPDVVYGDFQDAPELGRLARALADEYEGDPRVNDVLWHSEGCEIRYAWKRQGGRAKGRATLGKCVKLSGPAKHFAKGADFLIWIAWDHTRNLAFTRQDMLALLFHELHHIQRDVTDDGEDVYSVRGHDLEVFFAEIEVFGAWLDDIERGRKAFEQLGLGV